MTNLPVRTAKGRQRKGREKNTKPFRVSSTRSRELYQAAQELACDIGWGEGPLCLGTHHLPEARCRPLQCNHQVLYAL